MGKHDNSKVGSGQQKIARKNFAANQSVSRDVHLQIVSCKSLYSVDLLISPSGVTLKPEFLSRFDGFGYTWSKG